MKTATRYQLVLQFPAASLAHYDAIIALETQLEEVLGESAELDGHDMGSAEANIFIITYDPEATFRGVLPVLQRCGRSEDAMVAFRDITKEQYQVLWPEHSARDFTVA